MIKPMGMGNISRKMGQFTKDIGKMTSKMGLEWRPGGRRPNMKVSMWMGRNKDRGFLLLMMGLIIRGSFTTTI